MKGPTGRFSRWLVAAIAVVLLAATVLVAVRLSTEPAPQLIPGARAVPMKPPLHTTGGQIFDSTGRAIRILGIQVHGLASGTGGPANAPVGPCKGYVEPTQRTFDDVVSWGFNSVRLGISWSNLEPTPPTVASDGTLVHTYDQPYLTAVDHAISGLTGKGLGVIIEMAQSKWSPAFRNVTTGAGVRCAGYGMPAWLYPNAASLTISQAKLSFFQNQGGVQDQYAAVCKFIAGRYAGNPFVMGYDMMNEPYSGSIPPQQFDLSGLYQRVGSAIRSVDPNILLMFQDTQDLGTGQFALQSPPAFPNVVYSFHLYVANWDPEGLARTLDYQRRAERWHVPLWIGEFAAFGYARGGNYPFDWRSQLGLMMKYCDVHRISWNLFASGPVDLGDPTAGNPPVDLIAAIQGDFPIRPRAQGSPRST